MINAGGIANTAQILAEDDPEQAKSKILDFYSRFAGRTLSVGEAKPSLRSERATGHRSRTIRHPYATRTSSSMTPSLCCSSILGSVPCWSISAILQSWQSVPPVRAETHSLANN